MSKSFREAREEITGDSWLDDLARASLSRAEAKFGTPVTDNRPYCQRCQVVLKVVCVNPLVFWCPACDGY